MDKTKKIIASIGIAGGLAVGSQVPIQPNLTVQEWQEVRQMYNHEIEALGGKIKIDNFNGDIKQLNDVIRKRSPENEVYAQEREALLKRTESQTVLETLLTN